MKEHERKEEEREEGIYRDDESELLELMKQREEENEALQNLINALTKKQQEEKGRKQAE
ncbi:hypothetical protein V6R21_13940 [Limibacter armeniacum]|uniref:hypothetical protein n=1 Tax=Limibacter armeniacum TaxID=466084 RepID=UPI002FE66ED2